MILYHFTALENVEAIRREGLLAAYQYDLEGDDAISLVGGGGLQVVYLCDSQHRGSRTLN